MPKKLTKLGIVLVLVVFVSGLVVVGKGCGKKLPIKKRKKDEKDFA